MKNGTMCAAGLAFAVAIGGTPALAEESYSMDGRGNNDGVNAVIPAGEGAIVLHAWSNATLELDDPSNPAHGATGICSGSVLVTAGEPEGSGLCTYGAAGGDTLIIRWQSRSINESRGVAGTWELVGGSGRWASATASGTFSDVPDEISGTSTNHFTGELRFD